MPISVDAEEEIEDVVESLVGAKSSFTAYTVTNELRSRGFQERHKDIKAIVHRIWKDDRIPDYSRHSVTLSGGIRAYLYHPDDIEPDDAVNFMVHKNDNVKDAIDIE